MAGGSFLRCQNLLRGVIFRLAKSILNLAVHPEHRRRGLARRLLAEGLAQARTSGAELAWLEVRTSNLAAQALYASFGFKEVGRRPRYYDDTQEDALLLTLDWGGEKG